MADIIGFTKQTFKLASQPAFIIESPDAMQIGMGAALKKQEQGSGSVTIDKLYGQSGVMQLPPGTKLQQFKNEHPGNNFQAFLDFLARDISWGIGLSPEMLWSVAGIGGANTRYVLADAQVFFSELQEWLINSFCRRYWKYWIWQEIQAGRLPLREDWFRVDFSPPARATVDFGRDTKALLEIVRTGAMSTRRFAEMHGHGLPLREDWFRVDFIPPARATVDFGRDTTALLEIVRTGAMSTRRFAAMHGLDEESEEDAANKSAKRLAFLSPMSFLPRRDHPRQFLRGHNLVSTLRAIRPTTTTKTKRTAVQLRPTPLPSL